MTKLKKVKLDFGSGFKEYARREKLVFLYGIDKKWLHESFLADPSTRSLWFQLQWFCSKSEIEELETDYAKLMKIGEGPLYSNHIYYVDAIINYEGVGGYLDLLDSVASSLESRNFKVKRVFLEHKTLELPRDLGYEPFYPKPVQIDFFRSLDSQSFVPLDTMDGPIMTLPFKE